MADPFSIERERQLVERARSSSKIVRDEAFSALVRELGPSLHALCLGVTGSRADAEDAVQDALYTLASELKSFRGEARLSTWCYRIALRAAVRMKAKNRQKHLEEATWLSFVDAREATQAAVVRDQAQRLVIAIAHLPIEQRTLMTLFADGRSHDEIAAILDVPIGTVWSRLHSARKRLRELLG